MAGFDQQEIFTSGPRDNDDEGMELGGRGGELDVQKCKTVFKDFLKQFQESNFYFKYR